MLRTAALIIILFLTSLFTYVGYEVYFEPTARVRAVRKGFEKMPGVTVKYVSDLSKQAVQLVSADIEVDGKGEMSLGGLDSTSFQRSPCIILEGVGPYRFRTRALENGHQGYGWAIDIGTSSPIPAAKRLGITNVQSAIAHYDDLVALIADWPITTKDWPSGWPREPGAWSTTSDGEVHFADARGDYYFCLKRSDGKDGPLPPGYDFRSRSE
jgi:hypothetical protein